MTEAAAPFEPPIRPAEPDDVGLVVDTWLEGYRRGSPWARRLTNDVFFAHHGPVVAALLGRSSVLCACDPGDRRVVYGYAVFEPSTPEGPAIHWVYVKKIMRRLGIGRRLLAATGLPPDLAGVNVTHPTYAWFATRRLDSSGDVAVPGRSGLEEHFPRAVHNPYLGLGLPRRDAAGPEDRR